MVKGKKGAKGKAAAPTKRRVVVYLPEETIRQLDIACAMEKTRRAAWLAAAIHERAKRYVVHVHGAGESSAAQGEAAA